jgi:hypothetical protein
MSDFGSKKTQNHPFFNERRWLNFKEKEKFRVPLYGTRVYVHDHCTTCSNSTQFDLLMNFLVAYQLVLLFMYYIHTHIQRNASIIQDTEVAIIWLMVLQIARISTVSQSMVRSTCRFPIKNLSMTKSMTFSQIKIDKSKKKVAIQAVVQ